MADEFRGPVPGADDSLSAEGMLMVGIGASAGGIAALRQLFAHVPARSGAAYAVILHLSPDYESRLAEVLRAATPLPILQVQGTVPVEPDHIYVIAPNASLAMAGDTIVSAPVSRADERRSPVDHFFRTLADSYGRYAVSVVLSGTGPNGSSGLKRVKEQGGLVIAQDPNEAEYGEMPQNSIDTGLVDYVLPVAEIAATVLEYHGRLRRVEQETPRLTPIQTDADGVWQILTLLRVRTGHDFSNYKPSTILRRIECRLSVVGVETLLEYADVLQRHADEAPVLMKELLVSVTSFFRDPEAYEVLEQRVLPQIFRDKRGLDQVRAWVAGCATGEEAYSLAMVLWGIMRVARLSRPASRSLRPISTKTPSRSRAEDSIRRPRSATSRRTACSGSSHARSAAMVSAVSSAKSSCLRPTTSSRIRRSRTSISWHAGTCSST